MKIPVLCSKCTKKLNYLFLDKSYFKIAFISMGIQDNRDNKLSILRASFKGFVGASLFSVA